LTCHSSVSCIGNQGFWRLPHISWRFGCVSWAARTCGRGGKSAVCYLVWSLSISRHPCPLARRRL